MRTAKAGEVDARLLANVAHGTAQSGRGESLGVLFAVLVGAAERLSVAFNPQHLANTA